VRKDDLSIAWVAPQPSLTALNLLHLSASIPMASESTSKTDAPSRSLDRQVVLEEDEYTEALSHIIARDFFPSLVHLDATNNYLDALKSQDPARIQATVRKLEEINTPITVRRSGATVGATPTPYGRRGTYDTPLRTPYDSDRCGTEDGEGGEPLSKRRKFDTDMSLDSFQAKYTSEDNASFLEILEDENKKRKDTYGWAYHAQKRVEEQRERMLEGRERLLIGPPDVAFTGVKERFRIEAPNSVGLITQGESEDVEVEGGKGQEVAVFSETKVEGDVDVMAPKKDTRAAGVDGWKFRVSLFVEIPELRGLKRCLGEECSHVCPGRRCITALRGERFWSTL
jgi:protein DGCR14